tara:strand:- start:55 stop:840 length:786 start_codon:yes stop_codon:yes gene_type:complete
MEAPPKILPIKEEENEKEKYHHPYLPDVGVGAKGKGSCLCLLSPRQTGKSTIASNLFLSPAFFGDKPNGEKFFDEIYVISPTINLDRTSRFLKKRCVTFDTYHPDIIKGILETQMSFEEEDRPEIAIFLDDCVGVMDKEIAFLSTKSRHFNIKLLAVSSQKFRGALDPILRANITDLIVGSPFPNQRDLIAIAEEFGDQFGGQDNWLKLYKQATPKKYDFAYCKLTNPSRMFNNFEKEIYFTDKVETEEELEVRIVKKEKE